MLRNALGNVPNFIRVVTNIVWNLIQVIISLVVNSARSVKNSVSWPFKVIYHMTASELCKTVTFTSCMPFEFPSSWFVVFILLNKVFRA